CRGDSESSPRLQFRRARGRDSSQVVTPFVQVGTYPTRNFATLGILVTPQYSTLLMAGPGHFCLTPYVAIRIGLYLHRASARAWRAVSEDPARISSMLRLLCFPFAFIAYATWRS